MNKVHGPGGKEQNSGNTLTNILVTKMYVSVKELDAPLSTLGYDVERTIIDDILSS